MVVLKMVFLGLLKNLYNILEILHDVLPMGVSRMQSLSVLNSLVHMFLPEYIFKLFFVFSVFLMLICLA